MVCSILITVILIAVIAGYIYVSRYIRSEEFSTKLQNDLSEKLEADVTLSPLKWKGWHVGSSELQLVNGQKEIKNGRISDIRLKISGDSLKSQQVILDSIRIDECKLNLQSKQTSKKKNKSRRTPQDQAQPPSTIEKSDEPKIVIHEVLIDRCSISLEKPHLELKQAQVQARAEKGQPQNQLFTLKKGRLQTPYPGLEDLEIQEIQIKYHDPQVSLQKASLKLSEGGLLTGQGLYHLDKKTFEASGTMSDIPTSTFLKGDWKQQLTGTLNGDYRVAKKRFQTTSAGSVQLENGILKALPILKRIAAYTNTSRFLHIPLSQSSFDFEHEKNKLTLRNIELYSAGLLKIKGEITMRGEQLSGVLKVGLPPEIVSKIPGGEKAVFTHRSEGLYWADVTLSGTKDKPKEDLSRRIILAAGTRLLEIAPETGEALLKVAGSTDELTTQLLSESGLLNELLDGKADQIVDKIVPQLEKLLPEDSKITKDILDKIEESGGEVIEKGLEKGIDSILDIFGK